MLPPYEPKNLRARVVIQATRYGIVGIINTLLGLSIIFIALSYGASDIGANVLGYGVGLLTNFSLSRYWVFKHQGSISQSFARYLMAYLLAYSCNLVVVLLAHRALGVNVHFSQVLGAGTFALVAFLGYRCFAFAPHEPTLLSRDKTNTR